VLAPAFVDPHVICAHRAARTRRRSRAAPPQAAAGGYLRHPRDAEHRPVVDSAATLRSLVETATNEGEFPSASGRDHARPGRRGADGDGELADAGAGRFTTDGVPVVSAGLDARALHTCDHRPAARAHCEEPTLSRGRARPKGGRRGARLRRVSSVAESVMVGATWRSPRTRSSRVHLIISAAESVAALRRAQDGGAHASGEYTASSRAHQTKRAVARREREDEPTFARRDRVALLDGAARRTMEAIATDHAPHARHEKDVPFEAAPFASPGLESLAVSTPSSSSPGCLPPRRCSRSMPGRRALRLERPRHRAGARANLVLARSRARTTVTRDGFRSRSANSWLLGRTLTGGGDDVQRRRGARVTGMLVLETHVFPGEPVGATASRAARRSSRRAIRVTRRSRPTELCRAARLLHAPMVGNYGVDPRGSESTPASRASGADARGAGRSGHWLVEKASSR